MFIKLEMLESGAGIMDTSMKDLGGNWVTLDESVLVMNLDTFWKDK